MKLTLHDSAASIRSHDLQSAICNLRGQRTPAHFSSSSLFSFSRSQFYIKPNKRRHRPQTRQRPTTPLQVSVLMVQYILTPWRDRQELLLVREQFYSASTSTDHDQQLQQQQSSEANTIVQDQTPVTACVYRVSSSDDLQHGARSDTCAVPTHAPRPSQHEQNTSDSGVTGATRDSAKTQLSRQQRQRQAIARVSMWMQRGNCPHMVESTALLTAAMLSDYGLAGGVYAVRAAYSAAFSRYVPTTFVLSRPCTILHNKHNSTSRIFSPSTSLPLFAILAEPYTILNMAGCASVSHLNSQCTRALL